LETILKFMDDTECPVLQNNHQEYIEKQAGPG